MVRRELVPAVSPPRSRPSAGYRAGPGGGYRARPLRSSPARSVAALAGAAFLALPAAAGSASTSPSGDLSLSNEWNRSTWAYAAAPAPIYARPDRRARRVDHAHLETEDGFPEVYLLLSLHTDAHGQTWVRLRIPGRPNGRTGWVLRPTLGAFHATRWLLVINLRRRALTAYFNGRVRFRAPVGVGKPSSPTPPGRFWVREQGLKERELFVPLRAVRSQ